MVQRGWAAADSTWPVAGRFGLRSCWRRQGACARDFCTSSCRGCRCLVCSFTCEHVALVSKGPAAGWQQVSPDPPRAPPLHVCLTNLLMHHTCTSDVPACNLIVQSSRKLSGDERQPSGAYLSRQRPVLLGPALPVQTDLYTELGLRQHVRCAQPSCPHGWQGEDARSARQASCCSIDPDEILRGEDHMSTCVFVGHLPLDTHRLGELKVDLDHKDEHDTAA